MLPASSDPGQAARFADDDPLGVITASPLALVSIARSHVENGAVKGDAASTSNNHVQATRIIKCEVDVVSRSKISAMGSVECERCFSKEFCAYPFHAGMSMPTFMSVDLSLGTFL